MNDLVEYRKEDPSIPIAATHRMSVAEARTEVERKGSLSLASSRDRLASTSSFFGRQRRPVQTVQMPTGERQAVQGVP
jgi:hypothetical protein